MKLWFCFGVARFHLRTPCLKCEILIRALVYTFQVTKDLLAAGNNTSNAEPATREEAKLESAEDFHVGSHSCGA